LVDESGGSSDVHCILRYQWVCWICSGTQEGLWGWQRGSSKRATPFRRGSSSGEGGRDQRLELEAHHPSCFLPQLVTVGISTFVIGQALGSLLWAPLSEIFGRKKVLLPTLAAFSLFGVGVVSSLFSILFLSFLRLTYLFCRLSLETCGPFLSAVSGWGSSAPLSSQT